MLTTGILCLLAMAEPSADPEALPKLLALEIAATTLKQDARDALNAEVGSALARSVRTFEVITAKDIQTLVALESERQSIECDSSSTSCMAEIAGAFGARYLVAGALARVGERRILNLKLFDSETAVVVERVNISAETDEGIFDQIDQATARLTKALNPADEGAPLFALGLATAGAGVALVVVGSVIAGIGDGQFVAAGAVDDRKGAQGLMQIGVYGLVLPGVLAAVSGTALAVMGLE